MAADALYSREGEWFVPQPKAAGGWSRELQSGHAIAGLLASLVEGVPTLTPMISVRSLLNLTRPAPMKPCLGRCQVIREGKKLQVVRATLIHDGVEVADMTVLRARIGDSPPAPQRHHYPAPDACTPHAPRRIPSGFELRMIDADYPGWGPSAFWMRMDDSVIEGQPSSAFARCHVLADFGSGMANELNFSDWNFPNIDITLHLFREPRGDWLLLDAETESVGSGLALVSGVCADSEGVFGRAHQVLFIDPRR